MELKCTLPHLERLLKKGPHLNFGREFVLPDALFLSPQLARLSNHRLSFSWSYRHSF